MSDNPGETLSCHVPRDVIDMISRRAKHRNITKSRFVAMLLERWKSQKYPAIDTIDSTARALVFQDLHDEKSKAANPEEAAKTPATKVARSVRKLFAADAEANGEPIEAEATSHKKARRSAEQAERVRAKATGEKTG